MRLPVPAYESQWSSRRLSCFHGSIPYAKAPLGGYGQSDRESAEFPIILNYRMRLRLRGQIGFRIRGSCPFRRSPYCSLQCDGAADRKRVEDRWYGHLTAILGQFQTAPYGEIILADKRSLPCCGDRVESPQTRGREMRRSRGPKICCSIQVLLGSIQEW